MKLLTLGGGFTDEELASFKHIIYSNCISQMKVLVINIEKLEIDYELPENAVSIFFVIFFNFYCILFIYWLHVFFFFRNVVNV